ncbi:MAG: transglutaminase domain-containing protein [Chitinophagaceae bacterium]
MKAFAIGIFIFLTTLSFAQERSAGFSFIGRRTQTIEPTSPQVLAQKITASYKTDLEKVRSIFRWITENIEYNVIVFNKFVRHTPGRYVQADDDDTSTVLKPLDERVAEGVLKRKTAVCDGYARLFKTLCNYAGIKAEVITGYARTGAGRTGEKFRSNHTWNAVYIDSSWHLLDATWASGYVTWGDQFVKQYNDYYYLTPPKQFLQDHYPEDIKWTLLNNTPTLREFQFAPFKHSAFVKYKITSYSPQSGLIEASAGDTILLELETVDAEKAGAVNTELPFESADFIQTSNSVFVSPSATLNSKKVNYFYIVDSPLIEWLHVVLSGDVIMRYKLKIRESIVAK